MVAAKDRKKRDLFITLFAIVFSTSSLVVITRMSMEIFLVLYALFVCLIFAMHIKVRIEERYVRMLMIISLIVVLSMFINQDFSIINFCFLFLPWVGLAFFLLIDKGSFAFWYCNCMVFLALYSLIAHYVLLFVFPNLISIFPIRTNSVGFPVHDFIFAFRYVSSISRNTGLFREMGVYAIYLDFALYYMLFENHNMKYIIVKSGILVITVLSTLSTPGIIGMVLILAAGIFQMLESRCIKNWKLAGKIILVILLAVVGVLVFFPISRGYIIQAMMKLVQRESSYYGRTGSMEANLRVWASHPFFGTAYEHSIQLANDYYGYSEVLHNTSSNSSLLAMYGVFYCLVLYRYPVANMAKKNISIISKLVVGIALFMLLECQYMILDSLFWILMWYFIIGDNDKKGVESNI